MTLLKRFAAAARQVRNARRIEISARGKQGHAAALREFEKALEELNEIFLQVERSGEIHGS